MVVSYRGKKFYNIGPTGLYHKTLRICHLQKMDIFCSKLVSFGLDKHHYLEQAKTLAYYGVRTLQIHHGFYDTGPRVQCYKSIARNLRVFILS